MPQSDTSRIDNPFLPNLAQQKKRAKELCQQFRQQDPAAIARFETYHPNYQQAATGKQSGKLMRLSEAQLVIARELGLSSWPKLKHHIAALSQAEQAITRHSTCDQDAKTLHIRCGSDLQAALPLAGFSGDFLEFSDPYCQGPVINGSDWLYRRAEFLSGYFESRANGYCDPTPPKTVAEIYQDLQQAEQKLANAAEQYDHIVFWFEHDSYDLLILARLLSHFANLPLSAKQPKLDLIQINHFPGSMKFIGLGQLPPPALRLLWQQRRPIANGLCVYGAEIWAALQQTHPKDLFAHAHTSYPHLPDMMPALQRHLAELPNAINGLSLTEKLILTEICESDKSVGQIYAHLMMQSDPLPFLGDLMFFDIFRKMGQTKIPLLTKIEETSGPDWPQWHFNPTDVGRQVYQKEVDYLSLSPPIRWVGGIKIDPGKPKNWRWSSSDQTILFC